MIGGNSLKLAVIVSDMQRHCELSPQQDAQHLKAIPVAKLTSVPSGQRSVGKGECSARPKTPVVIDDAAPLSLVLERLGGSRCPQQRLGRNQHQSNAHIRIAVQRALVLNAFLACCRATQF